MKLRTERKFIKIIMKFTRSRNQLRDRLIFHMLNLQAILLQEIIFYMSDIYIYISTTCVQVFCQRSSAQKLDIYQKMRALESAECFSADSFLEGKISSDIQLGSILPDLQQTSRNMATTQIILPKIQHHIFSTETAHCIDLCYSLFPQLTVGCFSK